MAKFRFYVDFWPGLNPYQYGLLAVTCPGMKSEGNKRIAFDVAIPDELLYGIDGFASEVSKVEEIKDPE